MTIVGVELEHCPTERMLANPFTNPLQVQKVQELCAGIMNLHEVITEDNVNLDVQAAKVEIFAANNIPQDYVGERQIPSEKTVTRITKSAFKMTQIAWPMDSPKLAQFDHLEELGAVANAK